MRQGQGKTTLRKENGFSMLFRQCLRISKKVDRFPYWHLDLNAGSGQNLTVGCPGSPVVFLEEALDTGRKFNAMFCDSDPDAVRALHSAVALNIGCSARLLCEDNADAAEAFSAWITEKEKMPHLAVGSWVCDPNGFKGLPLAKLKMLCERHPRIDAILNLNISLFARVRGCKGNPNTPGFDGWPDPKDVLGLKPFKDHWLVRNPPPGGNGERFITFLGRNLDRGMKGFEEFYPIDSTRGSEIVNNLIRVSPGQGLLFED